MRPGMFRDWQEAIGCLAWAAAMVLVFAIATLLIVKWVT